MNNEANPDNGNLLLLMSGSIACAKASTLISEWRQRGGKVRVVCSRNVAEFIAPAALQGLGAELVFDNVFAEGQAMEHISLGQWADVILVAPATSNLINKLAAGIADDAVTTVWQAAYGLNKPMYIAPAMNTRMWNYPATQTSIGLLQSWGVQLLPVGEGQLACGEMGEGRLLEPLEILARMDADSGIKLRHPATIATGKRILITAGGTREPIDSVRYIGNISSGRTASALADELRAAGHEITWLGAEDAVRPGSAGDIETYVSFSDLQTQLRKLLSEEHFDVVIHAAAVSDFSVGSVGPADGETCDKNRSGKLPSDFDLVVHLQRNPKLLDSLRSWSSNPEIKVIGFKLTDTGDPDKRLAAVGRQFERSKVDAVVHNDLSEINASKHTFCLHSKNADPQHCENTQALAKSIHQMLQVKS